MAVGNISPRFIMVRVGCFFVLFLILWSAIRNNQIFLVSIYSSFIDSWLTEDEAFVLVNQTWAQAAFVFSLSTLLLIQARLLQSTLLSHRRSIRRISGLILISSCALLLFPCIRAILLEKFLLDRNNDVCIVLEDFSSTDYSPVRLVIKQSEKECRLASPIAYFSEARECQLTVSRGTMETLLEKLAAGAFFHNPKYMVIGEVLHLRNLARVTVSSEQQLKSVVGLSTQEGLALEFDLLIALNLHPYLWVDCCPGDVKACSNISD